MPCFHICFFLFSWSFFDSFIELKYFVIYGEGKGAGWGRGCSLNFKRGSNNLISFPSMHFADASGGSWSLRATAVVELCE